MRSCSLFVLVLALSACGPKPPSAPSGADAGPAGLFPPDAGLPCEAANLIANHCVSCHGATPSGNATFSLVQLSDFTVESAIDPTLSIGQRSVIRMQAATAPMPPAGYAAPTAAEISAFDAWVQAKMPAGSCAAPVIQTTCTSGTRWTMGTEGDNAMLPGQACISCHSMPARENGPVYSFAGTVYSGFHEQDSCNGTSPAGTVVEILDSAGAVAITMTPNSAGNFFSLMPVTKPYTARVRANGSVRAMVAPQTDGDCNSCHSEIGSNGAPGRIVAP